MSTRVMPFRGSVTSREQVSVYEFGWPAILFIPLVAILIQVFIPVIGPSSCRSSTCRSW